LDNYFSYNIIKWKMFIIGKIKFFLKIMNLI
jgi:hypothetical protein